MRSSLVSKLEKLALIPVAALILNSQVAKSQNQDSMAFAKKYEISQYLYSDKNPRPSKNDLKSMIGCDLSLRLGFGGYTQTFEPYPDWKKNFQPYGGSMDLKKDNLFLTEGIELGLALKFKTGNLAIGPRVGFTNLNLFYKSDEWKVLSTITVDWWDPVILESISMRKSPDYGIVAGLIGDGWMADLRFSLNEYKINKTYYKGVDCPNCVNYSEKIKVDHVSGIGEKLSIVAYTNVSTSTYDYTDSKKSKFNIGLGIFLEMNGKYTFAGGISYYMSLQSNP